MDERNKLVYWALTNDTTPSASAKLILTILAYYASGQNECSMSLIEIAKRTHMSVPAVGRNISKLVKSGHINSHVDYRSGRRSPNLYSLNMMS